MDKSNLSLTLSIILALAVPVVLIGGLINRTLAQHESNTGKILRGKGVGWQFIRYTVLAIAIPVTAILALNGVLTEGAVAIVAGSIGYAFGKTERES